MNGWRPSEESGVQAQKVVTVVRAETPQTVGSYEPRTREPEPHGAGEGLSRWIDSLPVFSNGPALPMFAQGGSGPRCVQRVYVVGAGA